MKLLPREKQVLTFSSYNSGCIKSNSRFFISTCKLIFCESEGA